MSTHSKVIAEKIVTAIEGRFRDWLMSGEHVEAQALVAEIIDTHAIAPALAERDKRIEDLDTVLVQADASLCHLRAEVLRLSRENVELRRGAPLERVISPNDSRVTDYTD